MVAPEKASKNTFEKAIFTAHKVGPGSTLKCVLCC
jgi:hypothetical protein